MDNPKSTGDTAPRADAGHDQSTDGVQGEAKRAWTKPTIVSFARVEDAKSNKFDVGDGNLNAS